MKVAVVPNGVAAPAGQDLVVDLFSKFQRNGNGATAGNVINEIRRLRLRPTPRAWDFAAIAMAVVAADEGCTRATSPDGWTRQIELMVAVSDHLFWNSQYDAFASMLSFLTGDLWQIRFIGGGLLPAPKGLQHVRQEDSVCLLSGGLDSLVGAIDLVQKGKRPLLVSQVAKGDKTQQRLFAQEIAPQSLHLQMNHNTRMPNTSERSQRGRSIGFFGFGALAATSLALHNGGNRVPLYIPENGYISVNIPLTPMRRGSLSTRTTHPTFVAALQEIFDAADLRIDIRNPYQFKTKGEMLVGCQDQAKLIQLASSSTSCGRYARSGFTQCGRCVPCLVRRAAFLRWGHTDATLYRFDNLGIPDGRHRDFDDVRSAAVAVRTLEARGVDGWVGGALNSVAFRDRGGLSAVAARGLEEVKQLLTTHGAL